VLSLAAESVLTVEMLSAACISCTHRNRPNKQQVQ
jgi:hypothetical protein